MTDAAQILEHPNSWPIQRYHSLSVQFIEAYRAYAGRSTRAQWRNHGYQGPPEEVEVFLLYHALELALKGWLLLSDPGITPKQLKGKYGHGLRQLGEDVQPHYPAVDDYLPLMSELDRLKYAYPDFSEEGIPVPMPIEPFAEFVSSCSWALFNALGEANTLAQSNP